MGLMKHCHADKKLSVYIKMFKLACILIILLMANNIYHNKTKIVPLMKSRDLGQIIFILVSFRVGSIQQNVYLCPVTPICICTWV